MISLLVISISIRIVPSLFCYLLTAPISRISSFRFHSYPPYSSVCSMFFGSQRHCARGFFSWKEEGDPPKWHWYVLFGICQRGNHKSLWLKPMPLRTSRGEARIPQISKTEYLQALDEAGFCAKSNCVAMTDAAPTFASTGHLGIVQHFSVNHSEKEFSRAVEVVYKGEIRPAICHTQTIDRAWRSLKENLPAHTSARSEEKKVTLEIYIRSQQWQMFHSGEDRWRAFCIAVEQFKSYLAQVPDNAAEVPQAAVELCRRDLRSQRRVGGSSRSKIES